MSEHPAALDDEQRAALERRVFVAELGVSIMNVMGIVAPKVHPTYRGDAGLDVLRVNDPDEFIDRYGRLDLEVARQRLDELTQKYPALTQPRPLHPPWKLRGPR